MDASLMIKILKEIALYYEVSAMLMIELPFYS